MCKSCKSSQSAAASDKHKIQKSTGGQGGGTPPVPQFIEGEHIPELTFISSAALDPTTQASNDRFLQSAVRFHDFYGLNSSRFATIEELIVAISKLTAKTHIGRLRIVTHAFSTGILASFCKMDRKNFLNQADKDAFKTDTAFLDKDEVKAFLKSDAEWLIQAYQQRSLLFGPTSKNTATKILKHIKDNSANAAVLTPFAFDAQFSNLSKGVENVILGSLSEQVINGNFVKRTTTTNPVQLTQPQKGLFVTIFNTIQGFNKSEAVTQSNGAFNAQAVNNLETEVKKFTLADYLINLPSGIEIHLSTFGRITNIQLAINETIRDKLNIVRQKFDETSTIDIRGCKLGSDPDFMTTLQKLFGQAGHLPHLSAPKLFQAFPRMAFKFGDRAFIDNLIANGFTDLVATADNTGTENKTVSGTDYLNGFSPWLKAIAFDQAYFDFFKTLLSGTALNFCAMAWKSNFPALKIKGGFQQDWKTAAFEVIIPQLKKICGVGTNSQPTAATITGLKTFVDVDIPSFMPKLTQNYSSNPSQGLSDLKPINTALNANISDPQPLDANTIQTYQTQIKDFINTNKLKHISPLLVTTKAIVEGSNPKIQLLLHFGLPGVSFVPDGIPDLAGLDEQPDVRTSNITALAPHKDTALRLFLKSLWIEDIPTGAGALTAAMGSTANPDSPLEKARQVPGLTPTASEVDVYTCPMPDYIHNIFSI